MYGLVIKELRTEKQMTQKKLAALVEKNQNQISDWELEKTEPNTKDLALLSNIFQVSVDYLIGIDKLFEQKVVSKTMNHVIKTQVEGIFTPATLEKTEIQQIYDRLSPHQQKLCISYMQFFDDSNRENIQVDREQQQTKQQTAFIK